MDNPERRTNFGLLAGNSKNHPIFGISCFFDQLELPFHACKNCHQHFLSYMKKGDWTISPHNFTCDKCYGFSIDKLLKLGKYKTPVVIIPNSQNAPGIWLSLKPGELTSEMLVEAWTYAISRYVHHGDWTVGNIRDYFRILCMNEKTVTNFVTKCRNYMNYVHYTQDPTDCDTEFVEELYNNEMNTKNYSLPEPPPMWLLCPIHLAVETPMHLQMNFVHYNTTFMFSWAKSISKLTQLLREITPILSNAKNTNVEGFKVIPIKTEKCGGYVAENWRCLCLLAPWYFHVLLNDSMSEIDIGPIPDPIENNFSTWRVVHLRQWLNMRIINLESKLTKQELVLIAKQQFAKETDDRNYIPKTIYKVEPTTIRKLHQLTKNYCTSLMNTDIIGESAEYRTTIYALTYLCELQAPYNIINNCDNFQGWRSTYTLLGILRAPTHFRHFRWVRSLYEGGDAGEGIIKTLRPLSPLGIKDGWSRNLLQQYYRRDVMGHLMDSLQHNSISVSPINYDSINHNSFTRYSTKAIIHHSLINGTVLSVLFYRDMETNSTILGCMINQIRNWYYCVFDIEDTTNYLEDEYGYTYFKICLSEKEYEISDRLNKLSIYNNIRLWKVGLALPCYWVDPIDSMYTFITEDGYTLNSNLKWNINK